MLIKAEKKWLKARRGNRCKGGYFAFTSDSIMDFVRYGRVLTPDYKDAAEFEARVAAKMTRITVGDLPCGVDPDNNDCQKPHFKKYDTKERVVGCDMCFLMVARLAVEAEKGD